MENEYLSEESADDEWVEIQSPSSSSNSEPLKNFDDSVIVSTKDGIFSDSEVFPPTNHEGLPVASSPPNQNQLNDSNDDINVEIEDEGTVYKESKSTMVLGFERLKCRIVAVVSRMRRNYSVSKLGRMLWLVIRGTTGFGAIFFLFVFLVYLRVHRRRTQAKMLENKLQIKEKDQKISELLLEIARLNDILLQQRRVPVLRV